MVNILDNQTQLDISIQSYGTVEGVFALLLANDISITDHLMPGDSLEINATSIFDYEVFDYYTEKQVKPASRTDQTITGLELFQYVTDVTVPVNEVVVYSRQSLLDIALQETGTIESLFELSLLNDLSISEALSPGITIESKTEINSIDVLAYYKENNIRPATSEPIEVITVGGYSDLEYVLTNYWL